MRESWTDERLDDFRGEVRDRFGLVDQRFDRIEREIATYRLETRTEFTALRTEMNGRFGEVNGHFAALRRLIIQVGAGLAGSIIVATAALLATQL